MAQNLMFLACALAVATGLYIDSTTYNSPSLYNQKTDYSSQGVYPCNSDLEGTVYPIPYFYDGYFICTNGESLYRSCTEGKVYDLNICKYSSHNNYDNITQPTDAATDSPTQPTDAPTDSPTQPTDVPTDNPTQPTNAPTGSPTQPNDVPTDSPTQPTNAPTDSPTQPTDAQTDSPTQPTDVPNDNPTQPTDVSTDNPTQPTDVPTYTPTQPTDVPTDNPIQPTDIPTDNPTQPTDVPTDNPNPNQPAYAFNKDASYGVYPCNAGLEGTVYLIPYFYEGFFVCTNGESLYRSCAQGEVYDSEICEYISQNNYGSSETNPPQPTGAPTDSPYQPTDVPTDSPTQPTDVPTDTPTQPTDVPTDNPTQPTDIPTDNPTQPTDVPTDNPNPNHIAYAFNKDASYGVYPCNAGLEGTVYLIPYFYEGFFVCTNGESLYRSCAQGEVYDSEICEYISQNNYGSSETNPPQPTGAPTDSPYQPTDVPTDSPTQPTDVPTDTPTQPTDVPTDNPTQPTDIPTDNPTQPTDVPTDNPNPNHIAYAFNKDASYGVYPCNAGLEGTVYLIPYFYEGFFVCTNGESLYRSCAQGEVYDSEICEYISHNKYGPSETNTLQPTEDLTDIPTQPSYAPTDSPTQPTDAPTDSPTQPTAAPTDSSTQPKAAPTDSSTQPTDAPTDSPTQPTAAPTDSSTQPTDAPTDISTQPTEAPTKSNKYYNNAAAYGPGVYPCNAALEGTVYAIPYFYEGYFICTKGESLYRSCSEGYGYGSSICKYSSKNNYAVGSTTPTYKKLSQSSDGPKYSKPSQPSYTSKKDYTTAKPKPGYVPGIYPCNAALEGTVYAIPYFYEGYFVCTKGESRYRSCSEGYASGSSICKPTKSSNSASPQYEKSPGTNSIYPQAPTYPKY